MSNKGTADFTGPTSNGRSTSADSRTQGDAHRLKNTLPSRKLESEYFLQGLEALQKLSSLPLPDDAPLKVIWAAADKLRGVYASPIGTYALATLLSMKSKCEDAIKTYINGLTKNIGSPISSERVAQLLQECGGNFVRFCAQLADEKFLRLQDLQEVVGLSNAITNVVPPGNGTMLGGSKVSISSVDPADNMTKWPSQTKRANGAGNRTVSLKRVGDITTIHQLQALVWGGRIESLNLPEPGKSFAFVKFMTAQACQNYLAATENGVEVPGGKPGAIVLVDGQPGPNSVNDNLQACIEGEVTRCVRALDADSDWGDKALEKLAEGTGKEKRKVDIIKRGRTGHGRYFIEFRFANIYDALSFKRQLAEEEDWERCTIVYAPDPCEIADGVHFTDLVDV
ncbi:uncharacterized protein EI97DRAFT_374530 [Westerdykella ornata]|uniref:RRM domain-containing protein n=1 Tax=Westerdykella ornata TaxID=318751 RepID=A0A6A6JNZ8_WESOR|nr:uncharacterized protein EI97DRAFT_374530 [Westerdykella ornata]KAF2277994.1 hypothetical protein EI97DRAFT_374530 [Westerdykella ornata]